MRYKGRNANIRRMDTCLLNTADWDFTLDAYGNLATCGDATPDSVNTGPAYRMAQDVATQCLSWQGEVYYDDTVGLPYDTILGGPANLVLLSSLYQQEALTVYGVQQCVPDLSFEAGAVRTLTGSLLVANSSGAIATVQL